MSEFTTSHVVSITPDVRRQALRYLLLTDGRTIGPYHASSIIACSVTIGCEFDESLERQLERADQIYAAKQLAMSYLGYAHHTEMEVRNYLKNKEVTQSISEEVIGWLREQQWVNDEAIGQYLIQRAKQPGSTKSKKMLASKLMKRGLSNASIASVLQNEEYDEFPAAKSLAEKKWNELVRKQLDHPKMRLAGYLSRRGFSNSTIRKVLNEFNDFASN